MTEQWEICYETSDYLRFFSPKESKKVNHRDFVKSHINQVIEENDAQKASCLLLSEGWEPFASDLGYMRYRRKYQG
jgi:hypothetical protein